MTKSMQSQSGIDAQNHDTVQIADPQHCKNKTQKYKKENVERSLKCGRQFTKDTSSKAIKDMGNTLLERSGKVRSSLRIQLLHLVGALTSRIPLIFVVI